MFDCLPAQTHCQVPYRLRHLRSSTGQLRFGTTTTRAGKPTSPSIPIGLARTVLHPHRIPDPATISLSLDSSRLHYSLVPFRFTVAYADPRVWMRSTATLASLAPLKVFTNSDSSPTRLASSIQPIFSYATIRSKPRVPSLQYIPNPLHSCIFPLRYCNLLFGLTLFRTASRI
jgi:hypothetical protein